jgi:hypothetical protein
MTERTLEDAVQVLQRRIGGRWTGVEREGRDELAAILKQELGYDAAAAHNAIEGMIASGQLRYVRGDARGGTTQIADDQPNIIAMSPNAAGTSGLPGAGFESEMGYWEIGFGADTGWEGRSGQVQPR